MCYYHPQFLLAEKFRAFTLANTGSFLAVVLESKTEIQPDRETKGEGESESKSEGGGVACGVTQGDVCRTERRKERKGGKKTKHF